MLKIQITGYWEPEDFIAILRSVESIYYKFLRNPADTQRVHPLILWPTRSSFFSYTEEIDNINDWLLSEARAVTRPSDRISISSIEYSSPGEINFRGLGKALDSVRGILNDIHDYCRFGDLKRRQEEIKTEMMAESLKVKKIETARKWCEFNDDFGDRLDQRAIELLSRDMDDIARLTYEGKITGIKNDLDS